jgi:hypothetical protein
MRKTILSLILLIALATYFFVTETGKHGQELSSAASMKLLDIGEGDEITMIRITKGDQSFAFEGKDEVWRIVDPILEMGNALILGGIEKVLRLQKKDKILNDPSADRSVYGLAPAEIKVGVITSSQPKERTLLIGKKAPLEDLYYAQWDGRDEVFLLIANARNAFDKELDAVRNRNIFSVSQQDRVKTVECVSQVFTIKLEYDTEKEQWLVKEPFEELARPEKVNELLGKITGLYIEKFLDGENVDDPKFGLAGSPSFIRFTTVFEKETTLHLGSMTEDKKYYYAHVEGKTAPVLVASDMLDSLRKEPNEFIERRIAQFKEFDVERLAYVKGGNERVLSSIENAWHLDNARLNEEKMRAADDLIKHLSGLEYTLVLNEEGLKKFDLNDKDLLFTFTVAFTEQEQGAASLEFAFYAKKDGYFVKSSRDNNFYEITEENYQKMISFVEILYG